MYIRILSDYIHKRHNKSLLLYHLVCPIKYRRSVLTEQVNLSIIEICLDIELRYDINYYELRPSQILLSWSFSFLTANSNNISFSAKNNS